MKVAASPAPYTRALLFLGFPDRPEGFDDWLLEDLARVGTVVEIQRLSVSTIAAVVTLDPDAALAGASDASTNPRPERGRCVSGRPAVRW